MEIDAGAILLILVFGFVDLAHILIVCCAWRGFCRISCDFGYGLVRGLLSLVLMLWIWLFWCGLGRFGCMDVGYFDCDYV